MGNTINKAAPPPPAKKPEAPKPTEGKKPAAPVKPQESKKPETAPKPQESKPATQDKVSRSRESQEAHETDRPSEERSSHMSALADNFGSCWSSEPESREEKTPGVRTLNEAPSADGKNCIDQASARVQQGDEAIFLNDNSNKDGNNAGHVVLEREGQIVDGDRTYDSYDDYLKTNSQYSETARTSGENLQNITNAKTPAERQAAIEEAGLQGIQDQRFADAANAPQSVQPELLDPKVPPHVDNAASTTRLGENGESIKETSYDDKGVHVQHIATVQHDGTTRIEEVRSTQNGVERTVTDVHSDSRPIEELVNDPAAKQGLQDNTIAQGDRDDTLVTHTVRTTTNNAVQPPATETSLDTTSYQQTIQGGDELYQDGQVKLPAPGPGVPAQSVPGLSDPSKQSQILTYTTGTVREQGVNHPITSLSNEVRVEGKNGLDQNATISQTRVETTRDGKPEGAKVTQDFTNVLSRQTIENPGGNSTISAPPGDYLDQVDPAKNGGAPGPINVRQNWTFGPDNQVQDFVAQYGNFANPTEDGKTVTINSHEGGPKTIQLDKVSDNGNHIQSQTVQEGTKLSTVTDTVLEDEPPTRTTRSETRNDGRLVSVTSEGSREVPASEVGNPPLDDVTIDQSQQREFLERVGGPDATVTQTYSHTTAYNEHTGEATADTSSNVAYEAPNGVVLSTTSTPYKDYLKPEEYWESNKGPLLTFHNNVTTLKDPNDANPVSMTVDDGRGGRDQFTETATGQVTRNGELIPDALSAASQFQGLTEPGANVLRAAAGVEASSKLGLLTAGLSFANFGHNLATGQPTSASDIFNATSATGTVLESFKPTAQLGKALGIAGAGLSGIQGLTELAQGEYVDGALNTALGVGGVLTVVGGSAGPIGWGVVLTAAAAQAALADSPTDTADIDPALKG